MGFWPEATWKRPVALPRAAAWSEPLASITRDAAIYDATVTYFDAKATIAQLLHIRT